MLALRYGCYRGYQERAENDIFVFAQPIMSTPGHVLGPLTPALGQYGQVWFLSFQRPPSDFRGVSSEIRGGVN